MKPNTYLLTLALVFFSSLAFAQHTTITYVSKSKSTAQIEFKLHNYNVTDVKTEQGIAENYSLNGGSKIIKKGAPSLPRISKSIIIPNQKDVKLTVVDEKFIEIEDVLIAPSKGYITRETDPETVPYEFGDEYTQNSFYPKVKVALNDPYILRDYRGQVVHFNPFSYNPQRKLLRIYTDITVEITEVPLTNESKNVLANEKQKQLTTEFQQIYKEHFLNYSNNLKYTPLEEEGEMLIISPEKYVAELDTFIQWKRQRGMQVTLTEFSTIGTTAQELQSYVQEFYTTHNLIYLLLVGDAEDIPSLEKSGDSDAGYGHISGDDSYAEVFVGRFSAESAEDVQTQVNRTIYYERDINETDTWIPNGIVISSDEGGGGEGDDGESDSEHMDNIRTDLLNYGYALVDQIYDPGATPSDVAESVNEGRSVISYVGHGSDFSWVTSGFSKSNVDQLTNDNKLPYIFDVACVNGNFHGQTCFAEAWMRATNNNNPTGAVAIIASTINQSWSSPMDAQDEMIDILTESYENNVKRTFGGITINGAMHMIDEYGTDGANMANTWTIFGDPSLLVRTKVPEEITATHNPVIYVGTSNFMVQADDNCTVSLTANNEIIATGITESGEANLEFDAIENTTTLKLTITGYNKKTYQAEITAVSPDSPYVIYDSNSINDEDENNNQQADIGEQLKLNVQLKNISEVYNAFNIETKLRTADANLVLIDSTENYGNILLADDSLINNAYTINLKDTIEDQHKIRFNLMATGEDSEASNYEWESSFSLTVNAPKLEILNHFVQDEAFNNNSLLDPGETVDLMLIIKNNGHAPLENITGNVDFIGGSSYFELIDSVVESVNLLANQIDTLNFIVTVDQQEVIDTSAVIRFSLMDNTYDFYSVIDTTQIQIGEIPRHFISDQGDVTLTSDIAYFYDSGGEDATYSSDESYSITFLPKDGMGLVKANFIQFDVEEDDTDGGCFDYLTVYNGTSAESNVIGEYCNENPPAEIIASNDQGALTFVFQSDSYVENEGWKAEITTEQALEVKFIVTDDNGPVKDALLEFNYDQDSTDANGEVVFKNVGKGDNIAYAVSKTGYEKHESSLSVTGNITEYVDFNFIGYMVTFEIKQGNVKLPEVIVDFNSEQKATDTQGKAVFEYVMPDNLDYTVSKSGYDNLNGTLQVESNDTTLALQLSISTGLNNLKSDELKVYPNPSNGSFNIEIYNENVTSYQIDIYDVIGSIVYSKQIQNQKYIQEPIHLSHKSKGIYFLTIKSEDGTVISRRLLIH